MKPKKRTRKIVEKLDDLIIKTPTITKPIVQPKLTVEGTQQECDKKIGKLKETYNVTIIGLTNIGKNIKYSLSLKNK